VKHSYSNTKKIAPFIHYILANRDEFKGQIYNFVDPEPVELSSIIVRIKSYLNLGLPKEVFIPYPIAKIFKSWLRWTMRKLSIVGIEARMPAELMFLENFYKPQTLSAAKLANTSYGQPNSDVTVFSELPAMIEYYLTRWQHLNLINIDDDPFFHPKMLAEDFENNPEELIKAIHSNEREILADFSDFRSE